MPTLRPQPTIDGHTELDARISPLLGRDLHQEIIDSVQWSQTFIQMTLPDRLIVSQKQFISLTDHTETMYDTEDRMFVTPLNVMEVVIDRDIDTVDEVEQTMVETDKLKKEIHDHDPDKLQHDDSE